MHPTAVQNIDGRMNVFIINIAGRHAAGAVVITIGAVADVHAAAVENRMIRHAEHGEFTFFINMGLIG